MNLKVVTIDEIQVLRIKLDSSGIATPEELKTLELPELDWTKGVVLEGRAPMWVYAALTHECHPAAWVGTYDPRLGGAVVTSTHKKGIEVGQTIEIKLDS